MCRASWATHMRDTLTLIEQYIYENTDCFSTEITLCCDPVLAELEGEAAGAPPLERGDSANRHHVIEGYLPLVRRIARRFNGRGERLEDLVQVGAIGLIGAVDRCDPERASTLTAYVAACVEGEIRRHLRDRSAVVRVPRRIQADVVLATAAHNPVPLDEDLDQVLGRSEHFDESSLARAMVTSAARTLDARERHLVALRYFGDLSQSEIGGIVGLSQVHVSRLLHGAIAKMRVCLEPGEETPAGLMQAPARLERGREAA
jgi:RNA polymerase sigma-B factor